MFANPERQEVTLVAKVNGEEKSYTLKLTTSASIALEKRLNMTTGEIVKKVADFSLTMMCHLLHAMLQKHHAAEFPPNERGFNLTADLIDDCGGVQQVVRVISEGVGVRNEKDAQEATDGPNPPKAQAGTGETSTLTLAASA